MLYFKPIFKPPKLLLAVRATGDEHRPFNESEDSDNRQDNRNSIKLSKSCTSTKIRETLIGGALPIPSYFPSNSNTGHDRPVTPTGLPVFPRGCSFSRFADTAVSNAVTAVLIHDDLIRLL